MSIKSRQEKEELGIYILLVNRHISTIDEFLIHLPDFHIIIYKKYQYTILPNQIDVYFIPKKPTRSKKPIKKRHRINKALYKRIKKDVAQINGLIPNPEVLRQYEFLFLLAIVIPISVLSQLESNGIRYIVQVGGREYGYIYCLLQQI